MRCWPELSNWERPYRSGIVIMRPAHAEFPCCDYGSRTYRSTLSVHARLDTFAAAPTHMSNM